MRRMQTKRIVMLMLVGLTLTCPAGFQAFGDSEIRRETLRGLQGVGVLVEDIRPETEHDGLTRDQVRIDVELRLRQSGIRVLSREERAATPGAPYLYVNINTYKRPMTEIYSYDISVELNQAVLLTRDPSIWAIGATTWEVGRCNGAIT
jgi:hypothetical protein